MDPSRIALAGEASERPQKSSQIVATDYDQAPTWRPGHASSSHRKCRLDDEFCDPVVHEPFIAALAVEHLP
jgi:hypothetical protein